MEDLDTLTIIESNEISPSTPRRLDENPAAVYLSKLSKNARRVQMDALNVIAGILIPDSDYLSFPWRKLEYQHGQALRTFLQEEYSAASINRMLSAVRETINQA